MTETIGGIKMTEKTFEGIDISNSTDKSIKVIGHIDDNGIKHIDKIEEIIPFEEQFPSLKGKGRNQERVTELWGIKFVNENTGEMVKILKELYDIPTIQQHCLDKQKVRDAIDEFSKNYAGLPICLNLTDSLKKDLGL